MRIISGKYKGHKINSKIPTGIRPTQDAIRETIFNILNNYIDFSNLVVADVCAGAGMLGIEAISRGANFVYFVDKSRKSIEFVTHSLKSLNITAEKYKTNNLDAIQFINHIDYNNKNIDSPIFIDLFFLDPPYNTNIVNDVLHKINETNIIDKNGIIVAETSINSVLIIDNQHLEIITERQFGSTKISFVRKL
ncbi:MAG: 16S rRNA (guanine(966)-N(2))-methyltransferase RsmD [Bacteroidetes bacterium]|nr:16S rRNA (guanine(966)-N(2))-methyltransferase RsmD [Bacteroidota bacterium]